MNYNGIWHIILDTVIVLIYYRWALLLNNVKNSNFTVNFYVFFLWGKGCFCCSLYSAVIRKIRFTFILRNFTVVTCSDQGILTNETRCLQCETVTARDETFLDLSLDIEQNSSITSCLKNFSSTETLNAEDKFFCDKCCRYIYGF